VLLLDPSGSHLVATAACGIEEEVRQGVRIPLGKGFAGRVAARREPLVLEDLTPATVHNPLLLERGIGALLGAPLLVGGTVLGVLHIGTLSPRRFTEDDVQLLQLAADRIALVTQTSLSRGERSAAVALQRSLLPTALPDVPGIELASRYVPGEGEVGGDWYDVFLLPSGRLYIVVGDIVGRGLRAAITMGRLRTIFRSHALDCQDPAEVLHRVDRNMQHFEPDVMATALCALLDTDGGTLWVSTAGHPPPVLAGLDEPADFVAAAHDLPLGVDITRPRSAATVTLRAGTSVCFYTDGLVERRDENLDAGLDRLRAVMAPRSAEALCAAVMAEMVGHDHVADDIAILTLTRTPDDEGGPRSAGGGG
jgi:phosphoserine phosphatase RsbU/P